ncbi:GAF domain-containing protein [Actinoplanes sp. G11-F43]|uniref:GAF domain-containing protein n=1 Tax=Actinoplanes sp. G11-F43 TaxID=3424130 RepID=UPI003D32AA29
MIDNLRVIGALDFDHPGLRAALDQITRRTADRTGLPMCLATLVMDTAQLITGSHGVSGMWLDEASGTPIEWSFCASVVRTRAPYVLGDAARDPVHATNPVVTVGGIRSYAGVPLVLEGAVVGAHCLLSDRVHTFTDVDLAALSDGARDIVTVLYRYLTVV